MHVGICDRRCSLSRLEAYKVVGWYYDSVLHWIPCLCHSHWVALWTMCRVIRNGCGSSCLVVVWWRETWRYWGEFYLQELSWKMCSHSKTINRKHTIITVKCACCECEATIYLSLALFTPQRSRRRTRRVTSQSSLGSWWAPFLRRIQDAFPNRLIPSTTDS